MAAFIARITLNAAWALDTHHEEMLPIDRLVSEVRKDSEMSITVLTEKLSSCRLKISIKDDRDTLAISSLIRESFIRCFPDADVDKNLSCEITESVGESDGSEPVSAPRETPDYMKPSQPVEREAGQKKKGVSRSEREGVKKQLRNTSGGKDTDTDIEGSALDRIEKLIGCDDFKELVRGIHAVVPQIVKYNAHKSFTSRSYLFAVNDGYGLSTCLTLFAEFLGESKLIKLSPKKIFEFKLEAQTKDNDPLADAMRPLTKNSDAQLVMCYDISEWMTKVNSPEFRRFLKKLKTYSSSYIFIFRVPFIEKDVIRNIQQALDDVMITQPVSFVPLDINQLVCCAKARLDECGFTAEEDVWEVFSMRINEEKSDGRFYGIDTVDKVVNEMIYVKLVSNATLGEDNSVIQRDEIKSIARSLEADYITAETMLDEMIGMAAVAARVKEIVAQIVMADETAALERPCLHMRFVGNPGTGKTTVARIVGKMLKENGILRNGQFFEYAGRDLVGAYVGHTAPKTAEICRDAYGSVLFIDEAYSLYRDVGKSNNDFGREALDTLIAEMENHRSDLVVIMAGYPDEMTDLMKGNPGLESRMPYLIQFPNFTRDDLFRIFMQMVKRSFNYDEGFETAARDFFDSIDEDIVQSKEFSNARFARNLYERTWGKAAVRRQLDGSHRFVLIAQDLANAISDADFTTMLERKGSARLGF
ncbi:MAG: AAA family ATPase [Ruminococcaceae bacterium]|nr:AAA family ATPase [Oscillospiraceae bacterium]